MLTVIQKLKAIHQILNGHFEKKVTDLMKDKKERTVTQVWRTLQIEQGTASRVLRKLEQYQIVERTPVGKHRFYKINQARLAHVRGIAKDLENITEEYIKYAHDPQYKFTPLRAKELA